MYIAGAISSAATVVNVWLIMQLSTLPGQIQPPKDPPYPRQIILDGIHPRDMRELNLIYSCEQCSYFSSQSKRCAMGFKVEKHMRENQLKLYNLTGKMAICRSQEID